MYRSVVLDISGFYGQTTPSPTGFPSKYKGRGHKYSTVPNTYTQL